MRSTNVAGQTYNLMVLTPVAPGQDDALREALRGLGAGGGSPLARLARTHMARFVVVADMPQPPGRRAYDPLGGPQLLFTSVFDGDRDSYLDELCDVLADEAAGIWGRCSGCPQPAAGAPLKAYLIHNQLHSGFAFAAYGDASVARIETALDKRARLIDFAIRAQQLDPAARRRAFLAEFGDA